MIGWLTLGAAAVAVLAYALERRIAPLIECRRCAGRGNVRRWHLLTRRPCTRCAGTGRRPRWGAR